MGGAAWRAGIVCGPRFWLMLSLVAALVFCVSFLVAHSRLEAERAEVDALIAERDSLVREIGALEKDISFAQTDDYVERAARDSLGLIMPGEVRYVNASS